MGKTSWGYELFGSKENKKRKMGKNRNYVDELFCRHVDGWKWSILLFGSVC